MEDYPTTPQPETPIDNGSPEPTEPTDEDRWIVPAGSRLEVVLGDMSAERFGDQSLIEHILLGLPEREQEIVKMRFGLGGYQQMTFEAVGRELDLTREWIRQLQNQALERLGVLVEEVRERRGV
jgi:RNA polymerase sigma factor (sigma-70 family)